MRRTMDRAGVIGVLTITSIAIVACARAGEAPSGTSRTVLPDNRLGIRTVPLLLLSRPDVRTDVALDERQVAEADRAVASLYARAAALKGRTGPEAVAGRRTIDEAQQRWLETWLSDQQRSRLIQIDLQWEGPSALISRPIVAESLGLSASQRALLTEALSERNQRRAQGAPPIQSDRLLAEKALQVLTEPQRERWKAMLGRPFILGREKGIIAQD